MKKTILIMPLIIILIIPLIIIPFVNADWVTFDDFNETSLNSTRWLSIGLTASSNGSVMHIDGTGAGCAGGYACMSSTPFYFGSNNITRIRARVRTGVVTSNAGIVLSVGNGSYVSSSLGQQATSVYTQFPTTPQADYKIWNGTSGGVSIGNFTPSNSVWYWYEFNIVGSQAFIQVYNDSSGTIDASIDNSSLTNGIVVIDKYMNLTFSDWGSSTYGFDIDIVEYYLNTTGGGTSPAISLTTGTTTAGVYYNETTNNITGVTEVTDYNPTNTTITLYNGTITLIYSNTTTPNFTATFTSLPTGNYTLSASSTNGTSTINATSRTIIIYGFTNTINTPTESENLTRYLNITYTDTITPTGAINISSHNISILNSDLSLNYTINGSTNASQYVDLFSRNFTIGTYEVKLSSKDTNNNTHNATRSFNLTRDAEINITAKYILNNATITNFTINITDESTGTTETNTTTNNKSTLLIIKNRNYTITIDSPEYAITNTTHNNYNQSLNNITLYIYTSNSVQINIFDETTNYPITQNITITFTQNLTEIINSTITGSYYQDGLTEGTWDIKFLGANYTLKTYTITVANRSTQTLNAYLSTSTQTTIFTIMDYDTGGIIPGATVTMSKLINGSWTIVNVKNSDITGRVQLIYTPGTKYQFLITMTGYESNLFYLDPILFSTYNIRMTKTTTLTPTTTPDLTAVDINYYNNLTGDTTWLINGTNNLIWIISSPIGSLENYNLTLTYPGGSQFDNGNLATGEQFNMPFNITGANSSSRVIIAYCYKSTTSYNKCFNFPYSLIGAYDNTSMIANKNTTYGLSPFERVLIVTIIVLMVGGAFYMIGGAMAGLVVSLIVMGFFMTIGFTTIWMNLPSLFIGLIILFRKGGGD